MQKFVQILSFCSFSLSISKLSKYPRQHMYPAHPRQPWQPGVHKYQHVLHTNSNSFQMWNNQKTHYLISFPIENSNPYERFHIQHVWIFFHFHFAVFMEQNLKMKILSWSTRNLSFPWQIVAKTPMGPNFSSPPSKHHGEFRAGKCWIDQIFMPKGDNLIWKFDSYLPIGLAHVKMESVILFRFWF